MKIKNKPRHSGQRFLLIRNPVFSIAYWIPGQARYDKFEFMGQQWGSLLNRSIICRVDESDPVPLILFVPRYFGLSFKAWFFIV